MKVDRFIRYFSKLTEERNITDNIVSRMRTIDETFFPLHNRYMIFDEGAQIRIVCSLVANHCIKIILIRFCVDENYTSLRTEYTIETGYGLVINRYNYLELESVRKRDLKEFLDNIYDDILGDCLGVISYHPIK